MKNALLSAPQTRKPLILGTDWRGDCDDAAAIRILAWAHTNKVIDLRGISIDSAMECSVSSMLTFLEHEGIADVALSIDHKATEHTMEKPKYQQRLAVGRDTAGEQQACCDALKMYRRILAEAEQKVDILEIGFPQVLGKLLDSAPDEFSPLNGVELVADKVGSFWVMGGNWKALNCRECNFTRVPSATVGADKLLRMSPVPVVLLGFEVGHTVICGRELKNYPDDKLYQIFSDYEHPNGRCSWDPLTAYLCCVGDAEACGYTQVRGKAGIDTTTGYTTFTECDDGLHSYVVKKFADEEYERYLDEIITDHYKHICKKMFKK